MFCNTQTKDDGYTRESGHREIRSHPEMGSSIHVSQKVIDHFKNDRYRIAKEVYEEYTSGSGDGLPAPFGNRIKAKLENLSHNKTK